MLLLNEKPVSFFKFSGGEIQVKIDQIKDERAILTWKPDHTDDIMLLLLTVDALQREGFHDIQVEVLYLPYARQDRVCSQGEAYSLEVMVRLLDNMNVCDIRFWDLHNSDLTLNMFKNTCVHETEIHDVFSRYKTLDEFDLSNLILCAPDTGARDKIDNIVNHFELGNGIHFEKNRNVDTGLIEGIKPNKYNRDFDGYNILVVDDICDGGRTFIEVAKELRMNTSEKLFLYVTHGIFSKGLDELYKYFEHIYCHHVLHDDKYKSTDRLTILREFPSVSQSTICN